MIRWRNLVVVGTSHIAPESIAEVSKLIYELKPVVVALELDKYRLHALMSKPAHPRFGDVFRVGFKGFLFSLFGAYVERKLGEKVGVRPGAEMLASLQVARDVGAKVALIDQNIEVTLSRVSSVFSWREKFILLKDLFDSVILRRKGVAFDLERVPDAKVVEKVVRSFKRGYPNLYKVLVSERNVFMAEQLKNILLSVNGGLVVAVVGAGHERDIVKLLKKHFYT